MRILILVLCLLMACLALPAQLAVRNYTTDHGLPSNNVYCVFSDQDGFLWFGTDNGLARFDGKNFRVFTSADGLADNEIFGLFQDSHDRMWLRTYSGKACYLKKGHIFTSANDTSLKPLDFESYTFSIAEANDTLYFTGSRGGLGRYHDGKATLSPFVDVATVVVQKNKLYAVNNLTLRPVYGGQVLSNFRTGGRAVARTAMYKGDFHITSDNFLLRYSLGKTEVPQPILEFPSRLQFIASDADTALLLGTERGAFRYYPETGQLDTLLTNFAVSHIAHDFEGGLWITTLSNGIFYFGNSKSQLKGLASPGKPHPEYLFGTTPDGKQWFCIGQNGDLTYLNSDKTWSIVNLSPSPPWGRVRSYTWMGDDSLFISAERLGSIYEPKKQRFSYKTAWVIAKVMLRITPDSTLISAGGTFYNMAQADFCALALGKMKADPLDAKGVLRINCAMVHEGRLLAGANDGLYIVHQNKYWKLDSSNSILNDRVNAMTLGDDGQIWIGLANEGILLLQGDKASMVDPQFKIVNVRKLRMGPDHSLWACNHEGVFKFTRKPDGTFLRETFTSVYGYPISNTWDILPMPNFTYAATDQGLIRFEASTNDTPPRLIVEEVDYDGQALQSDAQAPIFLDHSGKRLTVKFAGINFRNYGQLTYRYRIPQIDDQWQTTTTTEIEFLDMRHGDYVFELKAEGNSGLVSPLYTLRFSIAPQFWQTIWFLVVCIVVVIALVFLGVRRRVRSLELAHQREQEKSKKEIERIEAELYVRDLEQKAMRLQMNPHFIFNALNTIQGLYANKDIPKAKEYISKLSTLIRQILEQSAQTTITLGKELELVTGYLNVTLYRFENLFTFKINVQEGIQLESVAVPPLILQPIVENSVIHGIAPKGANGKIDIDVTREGESIVIRVRDNGVGLQQSQAMRVSISGKTSSKGMKLTQERLQHIWEEAPGSLVIEEIMDENNVVAGTMVTIRLAERMKE